MKPLHFRSLERLQLQKGLKNFAAGLLNLLYPPHCYVCETPLEGIIKMYICANCFAMIERPKAPMCLKCGAMLSISISNSVDLCLECANQRRFFDLARSFGIYEDGGVLASLIWGLKYRGEVALSKELAGYLYQTFNEIGQPSQVEAITFVPLSKLRQRERGFNQAELLAKDLGKKLNLAVFPALCKIKETKPQTGLNPQERKENIKGAFALAATPSCKSILLIDDVYTTGATVNECSRVLKEGGYEQVCVLTVARAQTRPADSIKIKEDTDADEDED